MITTDPIADYLTRLRNALKARHRIVQIPYSKIKIGITEILHDQGYILSYKVLDLKPQKSIVVALKYSKPENKPAIYSLKRISKPGLRKFSSSSEIPAVINGLGIGIISTSKGLMTDKKARELKVGGELICEVY